MYEPSPTPLNRRRFLARSGGLCVGCLLVDAASAAEDRPAAGPPARPVPPSWSSEQAFNFAYRDQLIPIFVALASRLGREKLVELLKAGTDETWSAPEYFPRVLANYPKGFWEDAVTSRFWTDSDGTRRAQITRCLWAETFRQADAADFGYAVMCYADYPLARTNHEKLERATTLMQGHASCDLRWTKDG